MKLERLIKAVECIEKEVADSQADPLIFRDEVFEIVSEFLEEVFLVSGLDEVEKKLQESRSVDTAAIRSALDLIEEYKPKKTELRFPDGSRIIEPSEEISSLRSALEPIEESGKNWSQLEIGLRLEMWFDPHIVDLLLCFEESNNVYSHLVDLVKKKLTLVKKDEILILWARLKEQFKEDRMRPGFVIYADILPPDFLEEANYDSIIVKLSNWMCKFKPLTVKRMIEEGKTTYPAGLPGVAKILSIKDNKSLNEVSNLEILLVRSASFLAAKCHFLTFRPIEDLARSIQADPKGFIFSGEFADYYKEKFEKTKLNSNSISGLVSIMKRLKEYAEEASLTRSNIGELLWRYKIGQEIISPQRTASIKKGKPNEIGLQKEISKFLIENGVLSFGRTVGRNEIDLYTQESMGENFAIEVKVLKSRPSESMIRKNFVQLRSYMDDFAQPRGIYVVFNCSDDLIIAPRKWLHGRVWVVAINLCKAPPSKRTRSLEIKESKGDDWIFFIENESKAKISKKKTIRKKK